MVDLFQVLDPERRFERVIGFAPEAYYNKRLATGFTLGLAQELKILQAMIRVMHSKLVRGLERYWCACPSSMVVSLVPNFNRALAQSIKRVSPRTPFVTVMTDLADYPPHFWVEPGDTEHLVCPTAQAAQQALSLGMPRDSVHLTSGVILAPRFYEPPVEDRSTARQSLGMSTSDTVGLVMFGGHGSSSTKRIATDLADTPLIMMCGRNDALRRALDALPSRAPRISVGFTDDVARWMRLADFFIGKPGPGSISEALHCGLPVIVTRNAWTMPQERWNTDWIQERDVGIILGSLGQIGSGVDKLIGRFDRLRLNAQMIDNRAVFEIPDILESIFIKNSTPVAT